jgi:hypothetical protein
MLNRLLKVLIAIISISLLMGQATYNLTLNINNVTNNNQPAYDAFGLPNTPAFPNVAVPAEAWLHSVGMDYWSPSYSPAQSEALLSYVGARWIRGTGGPTKDSGAYASFLQVTNDLNNANPNLHFKYTYMLFSGCYANSDFSGGNNPSAGSELYNIVHDAAIIHHIEIGNEIPNDYVCWNGVTYGGGYSGNAGSYNGYMQMGAAIHAALKTNNIATNVALSTSNYMGAGWDNACQEWGTAMPNPQCSGVSQNSPGPQSAGTIITDYLSVHNYEANPTGGWISNTEWDMNRRRTGSHESYIEDFCQGNFPLPCSGGNVNRMASLPGVATEGGPYGANWSNDNSGNCTSFNADLHSVQQIEIINKYIGGFTGCGDATGGTAACDKGTSGQANYNLQDGDGGYCNYDGIFQNANMCCGSAVHAPGGTGAPWPAATSLHNLTTILNDSGTSFTYGSTNWSITGCYSGGQSGQSTCHGLLLQKSNLHFWLVQIFEWNGANGATITVNFGQTFNNVNIYDPVNGTNIVATANGASSYTYSNSDGHPRIFEMW